MNPAKLAARSALKGAALFAPAPFILLVIIAFPPTAFVLAALSFMYFCRRRRHRG